MKLKWIPLAPFSAPTRLRHYVAAALFLGGLAALAVQCGTTLRPVDPEWTAKLLSPSGVAFVREACDASLKYADQTKRILVYRLDFGDRLAVCNPEGPYELVLILDRDDRVERHRLLRVK